MTPNKLDDLLAYTGADGIKYRTREEWIKRATLYLKELGNDVFYNKFKLTNEELHDIKEMYEKSYPSTDSKDMVNNPAHYGGKNNPYEVIKVIRAWGLDASFNIGNALKYLGRLGKKAPDPDKFIEDLEKTAWYILDEVAHLKELKKQGKLERYLKRFEKV